MYTTLIVVYCSIVILLLTALLILDSYITNKNRSFNNRLTEINADEASLFKETPLILKSEELSQIPLLDRQLRKTKVAYKLQKLLESSNLSLKVGHLFLTMLMMFSIGVLFTIRSGNILLIACISVVLWSLPIFVIKKIGTKRIHSFEHQFPDALDMMSNAIRAGFSINRAIQLVGNESSDPLGLEFRKISEEINLGVPFKDALINLSNRINSMDIKLFITAILIQRESGGNLNEVLSKLSNTIRERFRLAGQIRTFTAQGRLSQLILGFLPVGFGAIMALINPEYISVFFTEPLGQKLIVVAVIMQLLGYISINRITKIRLH